MKTSLFFFLFICIHLYSRSQSDEPQIVLNSNGHSGKVRSLHFTSDGTRLISLGEDKSIFSWQVSTGELLHKFYAHLGNGPEGMLFASDLHPNNKYLAVGGYPVSAISGDENYIILYDINRHQQIALIKAHKNVITDISFSKDGTLMASGDSQGNVLIWDIGDIQHITRRCDIHLDDPINDLDFAYHRNILAVAAEEKYFYLYDIIKSAAGINSKLIKVTDKHFFPVNSVKFSPDSLHLVSGGQDHLLNLFTVSGKFIKKIDEMPDPVSCVVFSSDGKMLVASSENRGRVRSYSIPGYSNMTEFQDHDNTITASAFLPVKGDGNYLVATAGGNNSEIFLWNPLNTRISKVFAGKGAAVWNIAFTEGMELLISNDRNSERFSLSFDFANLALRDVTGFRIASFTVEGGDAVTRINEYAVRVGGKTTIANDPAVDGRLLYSYNDHDRVFIGSDFSLKEYDRSGKLKKDYVGHQGGVRTIAVTKDERYLASAGEDQVVHLWDPEQPEESIQPFASLFITSDKQWVCWTPKGYFGCSGQGSRYFGWYVSQGFDNVGDFFSADQYFDALYRPEEVKQSILQKIPVTTIFEDSGEKIFDLSKLDKPSMALFNPPFTNIGKERSMFLNQKSSKYYVSDQQEIVLDVESYDGGGGIKELRIYQNDKLVELEKDVSMKQERKAITKKYSLLLMPGQNNFKVSTVNYQMVESRPDELIVEFTGEMEAISDLYILCIGLNKYMNSTYDLNYARDDATSFMDAVVTRGKSIFREIKTTQLLDEEVTADRIRKALVDISVQAKLNDVFIFYYAGHGTIDQQSENKEYYLIPYDVVQLYGNSQGLVNKGISASELRDMLASVKAQKQLILLDACHSGGAVQALAMRGAPEEKAIVQLARSSGIVLIAASGTKQFAAEFETLKHGAFTYVLLEALTGQADGGNKDQKITVNELKAYMEDQVPQVTREYGGSMQFPTGFSTGQDFPISVTTSQ